MSSSLNIVADANIPHAEAVFGGAARVRSLPGAAIDSEAVADADVLLVRSVTRVDERLLAGSSVRFVGSATIGTDHVDRAYLDARGIAFAHAPGSNAESVVEYVMAALLAVHAERGERLRGKTVGVVGCGQIGGRLARRLPALGVRVLRNDPPLAATAPGGGFLSLHVLLDEADIVTLHPPLTRSGPHPTHHLIGAAELAAMRPGAWLVNASRGAVVDNAALREVLGTGHLGPAILDVWEGEPTPDPELLGRAALATPHVAGYSHDGKARGTAMLAEALAAWLGRDPEELTAGLPASEPPASLSLPSAGLEETAWLDALVRQAYDVREDDARMRGLLAPPEVERGDAFRDLRRTYPRRRTFGAHRIEGDVPEPFRRVVTEGLGFKTEPSGQRS